MVTGKIIQKNRQRAVLVKLRQTHEENNSLPSRTVKYIILGYLISLARRYFAELILQMLFFTKQEAYIYSLRYSFIVLF